MCRVWVSQREQGGRAELSSQPTHRRRTARLDNWDFQYVLQKGFNILDAILGTIQMANTSDVVRQKNPSHVLHAAPHLLLLLLHLRQLLRHPPLVQLLQGFLRWQPHHIGTKQLNLLISSPIWWAGGRYCSCILAKEFCADLLDRNNFAGKH